MMVVRYIEHNLLCKVLTREDDCLTDIESQTRNFANTRPHKWSIVRLNINKLEDPDFCESRIYKKR
jgi:hypothetical protein